MSAFDKIKECVKDTKSFVLEAGAGSGKTYTLIQTINHILETRGAEIKYKNQKIICITYTNVAKNEIIQRLENNPLVLVSTIHEFLWSCIKPYNKQLLIELDKINTERNESEPDKYQLDLILRIKEVIYQDSSYRDFEKGQIEHDDLIELSKRMFENYHLQTSIIANKYPFIFIDEYQDTAPETVKSLIDFLLGRNKEKLILGFYGDSYQKIYDSGIGTLQAYVDANKIELITKEENYRSSKAVVALLNNLRNNITQRIPDDHKCIEGNVNFINCNNYPARGTMKVLAYEESIIPIKNENFNLILKKLEKQGWDFSEGSEDRILIIANSRVAERGGFGALYDLFSNRFSQRANEYLLKRENNFVGFFLGSVDKKTSKERETGVEHLVLFWENKDYNNIMRFFSKNKKEKEPSKYFLKEHKDKKIVADTIKELIEIRQVGTVKQVFDYVMEKKLISVSKSLERSLSEINLNVENIEDEIARTKIEKNIKFYNELMNTPYKEFIELFKHTQNQTVFSTKHGTKGEEYRNVLVVIDDTSWKQKYNFENFFDNTEDREDRKIRTQNLFYVSCSRARENLVVLSLSEMKEKSVKRIIQWFGKNQFYSINEV